jgi:hypothetical protein
VTQHTELLHHPHSFSSNGLLFAAQSDKSGDVTQLSAASRVGPVSQALCVLLTALTTSVPPNSWYLRLLLMPMCSDQQAALPSTVGGSF